MWMAPGGCDAPIEDEKSRQSGNRSSALIPRTELIDVQAHRLSDRHDQGVVVRPLVTDAAPEVLDIGIGQLHHASRPEGELAPSRDPDREPIGLVRSGIE